MEKLQLYYHFPFCLSKCAYCAFYSLPGIDEGIVDKYVKALIRQTEDFDAEGYEVCTVYFGGGTPTLAGAGRLSRLLEAIYKRFCLSPDAEITVEANPKTIDAEGFKALKGAGVNRVSIGAQSFNDGTLALIGRPHTAADFVRCFGFAREAGFENISADLIFALPGEKSDMLMHSVRSLIDLGPEHISVYGLTLEEGTELWRRRKSLSFPDEEEEERQYFLLCSALAAAGYEHYEISNFAKPGRFSRHNTGYWRRTPYFGFGAGAHSFFGGRRFCTPQDVGAYIDNVGRGFLAPTGFDTAPVIGEAEAEEERIMLGLRMADGIELTAAVPRYLSDAGLVTYKDGRVCLTEKGFRVSNAVISKLI